MTNTPQKKDLKNYFFLGGQLLLFIAFVWPTNWGYFMLSKDFIVLLRLVAFMALAFSLVAMISFDYLISPFPSPNAKTQLKTTGVYKYSRHPIYTGLIFFFLAWAVANTSYYQLFVALLFFVLIYFKAKYEEEQLSIKFNAYISYKKQTRMFL